MDDTAESGLADEPAERTTADLLDADEEPAERTTADLLEDDAEEIVEGMDRWTATKYIAPFVAIGLFDLVLLLGWGLDPLWGFMILPPILFISVLGWIAFRTGFASDRT